MELILYQSLCPAAAAAAELLLLSCCCCCCLTACSASGYGVVGTAITARESPRRLIILCTQARIPRTRLGVSVCPRSCSRKNTAAFPGHARAARKITVFISTPMRRLPVASASSALPCTSSAPASAPASASVLALFPRFLHLNFHSLLAL